MPTTQPPRREVWSIELEFHFGGFAKVRPELFAFIDEFKVRHEIQLDPIYTGKMMYGIFTLVKRGYFSPGSTIVAVHTGGGSRVSWEGLRPRSKD
jgi:1-aminocyclopropane-1-carboxylate deaminase